MSQVSIKKDTKRAIGQQSWIDAFMEYTKQYESPTLFHAWVGIQTVAAALDRRVFLDKGYQIYPNMYTVLVAGTAACRKGTAIDLGKSISGKVQGIRHYEGTITAPRLIGAMKHDSGSGKKAVQEGTTVQFPTDSPTDSLYVLNGEMSMFMTETNRDDLEATLTELYTPKDAWDYQTKTRGCVGLKNTCLNTLFATNPRWLAKSVKEDSFEGGFAGRVMWIYQDQPRTRNGWPENSLDRVDLGFRLRDDLQHIVENIKGEFGIESRKVRDKFKKWDETRKRDYSNFRMIGFQERKPDHILKLAMVLSACESDERVIRGRHIDRAKLMVEQIEENMPYAFRYVGTEDQSISEEILNTLGQSKGTAYQNDLLKAVKHRLKNGKKQFLGILEMMADVGEITCHGASAEDKNIVWTLTEDRVESTNKRNAPVVLVPDVPERTEEVNDVGQSENSSPVLGE